MTLPEVLRQRPVTYANANHKKRNTVLARKTILYHLGIKDGSETLSDAWIDEFKAAFDCWQNGLESGLPPAVIHALETLDLKRAPSRSALFDWKSKLNQLGNDGLVPRHQGKVPQNKAWRSDCVHLYNQPTKISIRAVHRLLTEVYGYAVSYEQVRGYIGKLPSMFGKNSPQRQGKRLHKLKEKPYRSRDASTCKPGDVWAADGYAADVYLAHPVTGDLFRPELTVTIDVGSRKTVHWRLDEHEGTAAVQTMWAEAIAKHNHRPLKIYVDNGSGHRNSFMSDELTGFYARVGVEVTHALPGNPHGKGWIERFFREMKDDFLKFWQPRFYCGTDMAPEVQNETVRLVKRGKLTPPSIAQFAEAFNHWIARREMRPHPDFPGMSIAEKWAELEPSPPHMDLDELMHRVTILTVARGRITQGKRAYSHPSLYEFNGKKVQLEYDLMKDHVAIVRTLDGAWICDANLIGKISVFDTNRMEELRQKRLKDQIVRGERKLAEQRARAGHVIDADAIADGAALPQPRLIEGEGEEIKLFDL
jgi:putative transposase